MIKLEHIQKKFENGGLTLKDVNAEIHDGDVISIIGPSGTGKSTLLRCINMLEPPTCGKIFLDGEEITAENYPREKVHRSISTVFQSFNLFEHLTAIENVMLPQISVLGKSKKEAYDEGMKILASVGMAAKSMSYPSSLSGGQKQRVAIARTLAMHPKVILLDEPTSALDPTTVDEVKTVIRGLARTGVTMLIVTHDMELARTIGNRVFYMDEGLIYEDGTPEQIFSNPEKPNTRKFVSKMKCLEANISGRDFDYIGLMSDIHIFGLKNQISTALVHTLQLVTEELICSVLFKVLPDNLNIHLFYSYEAADSNVTLKLEYGGEEHNILKRENTDDGYDRENEISLRLIERYTEFGDFSYNPDSEYANRLRLFIKDEK